MVVGWGVYESGVRGTGKTRGCGLGMKGNRRDKGMWVGNKEHQQGQALADQLMGGAGGGHGP